MEAQRGESTGKNTNWANELNVNLQKDKKIIKKKSKKIHLGEPWLTD